MSETVSLEGRYRQLASQREQYLQRARACASVTIPSLVPRDETEGQDFPLPSSGLGARAVKTLSSKLTLGILPPGHPFFRLTVDEKTLIESGLDQQSYGEVEETLAAIERIGVRNVENKGTRDTLYQGMKHLLVSGNVLIFYGKKRAKHYPLSKYVVSRDSEGETEEIILCEEVTPSKLPAEALARIRLDNSQSVDLKKNLKVYTRVYQSAPDYWESYQEVAGHVIQTSRSRYPKGKNPWIAARLIRVEGEDYGRSYVEEHMGDFNTLEVLTRAVTQASVAAARIIFLVKPNAAAKVVALEKARNGEYVLGNEDDVSCLQMDKMQDFAIAQQVRQEVTAGLQEAFLMTGAIRRDAERVTAEEIRQVTHMLEEGLGGLYTQLAGSVQLPIIQLEMGYLQAEGKLPQLPKDTFQPQILTGIEALGREQELGKLNLLTQTLAPFGPEVIQEYVDVGELASRVMAALSIDRRGLVLTEEQREQRAQKMLMQQLAASGGEAAINQMMGGANGTPS
ncbi:portal protein [Marinobacter similis]|uniref:Head-tail joining protein n=1 Tax=Marinobacter similis TaxID=1420916 RepID=W5YMK4_9GAMM|nr:portal protein [Marinobacter similis]AHI30270.1 hypothetical protein AU14_17500 [Marinobacter similis]